jgi:hypothetical protein
MRFFNEDIDNERNVMDSVYNKLKADGHTSILPAVEGQFNKFMEQMTIKLKKIERNKEIKHSKEDVCMVLLEVK